MVREMPGRPPARSLGRRCGGGRWEKPGPSCAAGEDTDGAAAVESSVQAPPNIQHRVPVGSGSPVSRDRPQGAGSRAQTHICAPRSCQRHSHQPSTDERIRPMPSTHTMAYDSTSYGVTG